MGRLTGEGLSRGWEGWDLFAEHNNLFVTIRDGEVGDPLTGLGPQQ